MITNIAVIEDNENFESYGTSPSFPVPDNLVQKVLDTNLSETMDTVLGEDKERHNHSGGIQLLTHNEISRIDLECTIITNADKTIKKLKEEGDIIIA